MDNSAIETHLDDALSKNLVYLNYQPKVNIDTGKIVGSEALMRLPHLNGVYVQPSKIIDIAERNGQIIEIGNTVLREACRGIHHMLRKNIVAPVSVNVSVAQILNDRFYKQVVDTLAEFRLTDSPELLELEITESVMINDPGLVVGVLRKLNDIGIRLFLDDFGVGFSSLNQLKTLPVVGIKIDKSFVDNVVLSAKDQTIVKIIILLAKEFNLNIIAEGIECKSQAEWLANNGCKYAQGYLFGKPTELDQFVLEYRTNQQKRG